MTDPRPDFLTSMPDRVIFWDFERTLAVRKGRWPGALAQALEPQGLSLSPETFLPLLATGFPWRHPDVPHPELSDPDSWWDHMRPIFARIYREAGVAPDIAEAATKEVRASYLTFDRWTVYPDTVPALASLSSGGWSHVLLSNHVPELQQIVEAIGLGPFFAEVITSATAGYEKPHPEIYRLAVERTEHPKTRWMVGDKLVEDVLAPEKAGIPGILVRSKDPKAVHCFEDLAGLVQFLTS